MPLASAHIPYGLSLDWGVNPPFRDVAMKGSMLYATLNPVVAWRVNDELSLALGPTVNYSKVDFTQGIAAQPDNFHFVGDDVDYSLRPACCGSRSKCGRSVSTIVMELRWITGATRRPTRPALPLAYFHARQHGLPPVSAERGRGRLLSSDDELEHGSGLDWTDWNNIQEINFHNTQHRRLCIPAELPVEHDFC